MSKAVRICMAALAVAGLTGAAAIAAAQTNPAQTAARGQALESIVALVNDEVISLSDLRHRTRLILLSFPGQPEDDVIAEAQERALQTLIEEKVQLREFRKLVEGQDISDAEIDQEIAQLANQNRMTLDQFLGNLTGNGINPETLRAQVRAEIAWSALVRGRFGRQIRVSEMRIDEMLKRYEDSLDEPQYRIAEIFLFAPDAGSQTNARNTAATLAAQIQQGVPFEAVAQQFSAAPSASAGGDLGWISEGDMRPEIAAAVEAAQAQGAQPPVLLPPVESEGGVYLVAYIGKREAADLNNVTMTLKQVVARGDDATARLTRLKNNARTCQAATTAAASDESLAIVDMNDVSVPDMADNFREALMPLQAGASTPVLDMPPDGKTVLYVCSRAVAGAAIPTRDQIRSRLFETEITMLADRYLRDLKREATIVLR